MKKGGVKGKGLEGRSVVMMTLLIGSYLSLKITTTKTEKNSNLLPAVSACQASSPRPLFISFVLHTRTHTHTLRYMPYVFISS